jgi:DNA polymerase IV
MWSRAILLVDMNAFFASVEQLDTPELRGQPVAVTNGRQGSCIITSSYEARAFGVKTGMRLREARLLCPGLKVCPSRPKRYAALSSRIMAALSEVSPDIEVFSIDEAFLDLTHCQRLQGTPRQMAEMAKQKVWEVSHLTCSAGVSGDKTTAKYAANLVKPDGLTVIAPWRAREVLADVPVDKLCGIAGGIKRFLAARGVHVCGDMQKLPMGDMASRFGPLGRRIWLMCQGADPAPVVTVERAAKSVGHGKVMPPYTTDKEVVWTYLLHMCELVAARLRLNQLASRRYFAGLKCMDGSWLGGKFLTGVPCQDGLVLYRAAKHLLAHAWYGQPLRQIQITALDVSPEGLQFDLFHEADEKQVQLNQVRDQINQRYGRFVLAPARLLNRSSMHDVIAPAWRPSGVKRSV